MRSSSRSALTQVPLVHSQVELEPLPVLTQAAFSNDQPSNGLVDLEQVKDVWRKKVTFNLMPIGPTAARKRPFTPASILKISPDIPRLNEAFLDSQETSTSDVAPPANCKGDCKNSPCDLGYFAAQTLQAATDLSNSCGVKPPKTFKKPPSFSPLFPGPNPYSRAFKNLDSFIPSHTDCQKARQDNWLAFITIWACGPSLTPATRENFDLRQRSLEIDARIQKIWGLVGKEKGPFFHYFLHRQEAKELRVVVPPSIGFYLDMIIAWYREVRSMHKYVDANDQIIEEAFSSLSEQVDSDNDFDEQAAQAIDDLEFDENALEALENIA